MRGQQLGVLFADLALDDLEEHAGAGGGIESEEEGADGEGGEEDGKGHAACGRVLYKGFDALG